MTEPTDISILLSAASRGDQAAAQRLWSSVYDEIRTIAGRAMHGEYANRSIQATEIAHEAYLRLAGDQSFEFESRAHLLATVARVIRHLLVDRARARRSQKRGGEFQRVVLDDILDNAAKDSIELVDLDDALQELEKVDDRYARIVEMRFFGGMTIEEAASNLKIATRTAAGDWAFAKAWLRRRLDGGQ